MEQVSPAKKASLLELAAFFFKIGTIGFGGPAVTIGMMEEEAVHKRKWVSSQYFMEMLAATNIVPGPNATEMSAHLGYICAGLPGLLVGGLSFVLPGATLSLILGIIYVKFGNLPEVTSLFQGINPVVAAILTTAFLRLGKSAFTDYKTLIIGGLSLLAAFLGVDEVPLIFGSGLLAMLFYSKPVTNFMPLFLGFTSLYQAKLSLVSAARNQLLQLGLFFLKVGALLFGSTYVLIAFMQRQVVNQYHWLTYQQMLDAVAAGQITPGPISSTATFAGYVIAGLPGALVASLGMYIPSFMIVILTGKYLPKISRIPLVQYFLKGVTASAVALIAHTTFGIYQAAIIDIPTALLTAFSLFLLFRYKVDAIWIILGGFLFGLTKLYLF
ncbi:chromate efflux transporter [Pelolinea submarina]|uniref:Chromate transporter n=1 Tax=Pelolinea submarina TaxID=913107 RepID=A0A347ZT24_9CHLR|nr:chromate efflux transporter [Pelolinea submarina]REG10969.1 chromate transporter [Pelolinea submarina]BBB48455.1 chromate transporter [Pelolinea submarina]